MNAKDINSPIIRFIFVLRSHDVALKRPNVVIVMCDVGKGRQVSKDARVAASPQVVQIEIPIALGVHQVARSQIDRSESSLS